MRLQIFPEFAYLVSSPHSVHSVYWRVSTGESLLDSVYWTHCPAGFNGVQQASTMCSILFHSLPGLRSENYLQLTLSWPTYRLNLTDHSECSLIKTTRFFTRRQSLTLHPLHGILFISLHSRLFLSSPFLSSPLRIYFSMLSRFQILRSKCLKRSENA